MGIYCFQSCETNRRAKAAFYDIVKFDPVIPDSPIGILTETKLPPTIREDGAILSER